MANITTFPWRDCIGEGWHPLVEQLITDIIKMGWDGEIFQIKEKFGGLRFYIGSAISDVHDRIHKAEEDSYVICEDCGQPGTAGVDGGFWVRTLCKEHHEERRKKIAVILATCDSCGKNPAQDKHRCLYEEDLNNGNTTDFCNCCEQCSQICSDDL